MKMTAELQLDLIQDNLNTIQAIALSAKTLLEQRGDGEEFSPEAQLLRHIETLAGDVTHTNALRELLAA